LAAQSIIDADAGNYEAASKILNQLNTELRSKAGTWPKLIEIYIAAREEGIQRAQEIYDSPNTKRQKMLKRLIHTYYLNILKEDGLEI
jgi:thioredoxin-like negative regulator of GroEL